ncbi:hypothetical protein F2P81_023566 [Scophthalmus maximus]|uniref:Uncharacterized protein n=1 Tax=Scophthalmus maximus TaxID=52904 RepID=A0A6A4S2K3_SCOMX|nr:hypothetical protein F2P81_023566 [Scophthalmus maximus]
MPGKVLNKRLFETIAELCAALAILHAPDGLALHNLGLDEEEVTAFSFSSGCVLSPSVQHKYCRKAPYVVANCRNTNTVLHRCAQPSFVSVERGPHECVRVGKCLLKCAAILTRHGRKRSGAFHSVD